MRALLLALAAATALSGQTIVSPARAARFLAAAGARRDAPPLTCEVRPISPALNYGFRFQAGYLLRVPLNQYSGPGHSWTALVRITPEGEGRAPVHMMVRYRLPDIPPTPRMEAEVGGGYVLGEGRYAADWTMMDDAGRSCRKQWTIEARFKRSERGVKPAVPPGAVGELSFRGLTRSQTGAPDRAPLRLTVLLHAGPLMARRTRMRAGDILLLLGTLSSLVDQLTAGPVRLIVFSLDKQKVLYRDEAFTPAALERVRQSLSTLEIDTVDVKVLQNRAGDAGLLAEVLNREMRAAPAPDAIVFLGPPSRQGTRMPDSWLEPPRAATPRVFFLRYKPFPTAPEFGDTLSTAVARLKGRTVDISSPSQFAKAIEMVARPSKDTRSPATDAGPALNPR